MPRKKRPGSPKGTGTPSGKDRTGHSQARGKKAPTLEDLSRRLPDEEEVAQLFTLMERESDRGCALVAGSFVEAAVYLAVAARMTDEEDTLSAIFSGPMAPAGSFSAKIKLGLALAMYGPETAGRLDTIRRFRNAFAHALRPLDFTHPTIVTACQSLDTRPMIGDPPDLSPARVRYIAICRALFVGIYQKAQKEGGRVLKFEMP